MTTKNQMALGANLRSKIARSSAERAMEKRRQRLIDRSWREQTKKGKAISKSKRAKGDLYPGLRLPAGSVHLAEGFSNEIPSVGDLVVLKKDILIRKFDCIAIEPLFDVVGVILSIEKDHAIVDFSNVGPETIGGYGRVSFENLTILTTTKPNVIMRDDRDYLAHITGEI